MADLTTVILTYNEELNIIDCIESIQAISKRVIVIDSFSTDRTIDYAKKNGAEVYQNPWTNHAKQFKFGLENTGIDTKWVLRIDADERLTPESAQELEQLCHENTTTDINGVVIPFEVTFLGKKLKYGGIYPFKKLLAFKYGFADIEDREMDEHIYLLEGKSIEMKNISQHFDYKDLSTWTDKHNKYSTNEVKDFFSKSSQIESYVNLNKSAKIKRFIKYKLYYKLPLGFRPFLYFLYRYILKLGFLDGTEGFIFVFLQAFWYRFLVDAKIFEKKQKGL